MVDAFWAFCKYKREGLSLLCANDNSAAWQGTTSLENIFNDVKLAIPAIQ